MVRLHDELTTSEAALAYRIPRVTIQVAIWRKKLPARRRGGRWEIRRADLDAWAPTVKRRKKPQRRRERRGGLGNEKT